MGLSRMLRAVGVLAVGGLALGICLLALVPGLAHFAGAGAYDAPVAPRLKALSERTIVYDSQGNQIDTLGLLDREAVSLSDVSKPLIDAVIATEDRNFYEHRGIDVQAVGRALFANVGSGQVEQGGSTITQQLVKNRFFTNPKRDLQRKVRELALAVRLDREWSKNRILEEYLNTVYFGQGSYGVRAAAERFFQTSPDKLDIAQSALLAGVIASPEGYNPWDSPAQAKARRDVVLRRMVDAGSITEDEARVASLAPMPTQRPPADLRPDNYYVDEVQRRLLADRRLGATPQERSNKVFKGGLRVYTAYNPRLQNLAQLAVSSTLPDQRFTAAMAVMDPANGHVEAIVAGPGFERSQFNLATQGSGRQPGSTFKAITLATALTKGYSPDDTISGTSPCTIKVPGFAPWLTRNAEPGGGTMTLREATKDSVNCAYARLIAALGPQAVADMAKRMGISRSVPAYPSITLGTTGASPLDMATVYSTLAADGVRHDPVFITRVADRDGHTIFEQRDEGERVLSPEVTRTETSMLEEVVKSGTGTRANIGRPAAGKTGTTDDKTNAWFVGYTPQLTAAVWMGDPAAYTPMRNVGQFASVFGGTYPAIIWQKFMKAALAQSPVQDFVAPNERLWPQPRFISDAGRDVRLGGGSRPSGDTTTTTGVPGGETTTSSSPPVTTIAPPPTTVAPPGGNGPGGNGPPGRGG